MRWARVHEGECIQVGETSDFFRPGLADMVHQVGVESVRVDRDDGTSTIYVRDDANNLFGHCDTCGAPCDLKGCIVDRAHAAALDADDIDAAQIDVDIDIEVTDELRDRARALLDEIRSEPEVACAHCSGIPDGTLTIDIDNEPFVWRICRDDARKIRVWL